MGSASISSSTVIQSISCSLILNTSSLTVLSLSSPWKSPLWSGEMRHLLIKVTNVCVRRSPPPPVCHTKAGDEMFQMGAGASFFFFFLVIRPLPLTYFSLLSVIALAWNVVHGAFTRSISHAELRVDGMRAWDENKKRIKWIYLKRCKNSEFSLWTT